MAKRAKARAESPADTAFTPAAIVPQALVAYEQGQKLTDYASAVGIGYRTLMRSILNSAPDEWYELQTVRAEERLHKAEDQLELDSSDALVISRARESARAAQWRLERLNRRRYGTDQPAVTSSVAIQININRTEQAQPTVQVLDIKPDRVDR